MSDMVLASDVAELDRLDPADREVAVTAILKQSHDWLARAQNATDPAREVSEFKAFIATVAETSKQLHLSKEIQQDSVVMVRRAERALGVAIRNGQTAGTITGKCSHPGNQRKKGRDINDVSAQTSPSDYVATKTQLSNAHGTGLYLMADNVSDDEFEDALDQAQDEGNVSRSNVIRKIKSGKGTYESKSESPKGNRRRAEKQLKVLRNITMHLATTEMAITDLLNAGIDPAITADEASDISADLAQFARAIGRIKKQLTK